ncbi:sphingolipid long chain base-responsive protein PIL1 [Pochonia chlamydosporia 170]|uniref:Sphingolipid long chain base-responsive protein PIL1 n=1 Tax=Pochonia chlamydosporia 170 TaxID=1380566 RepID=A0A179G3S2_METCM|nr:sphingolipid long chain base-responsive protein PIL1 [Pochonia chlamydosporia 170]OAQ72407.1 sphingolipid long chain base-responsive protein PIL1 [Pochonia chlamydosporia 170]
MSRSSFDGSFMQLGPAQFRYLPAESIANSPSTRRNRALSIRSGSKSNKGSSSGSQLPSFSFSSLRGQAQPELSRKLFKLIKSENNLINAHEAAGRERINIATQLSEWGEQTGDDAISDISDKPSRDGKAKIADEIAKLKMKEPESARLVVLEQELVRAEAENLVAEAQLTNITRQKLKEAYDSEFLATIERAEKQIILAKHGRRLLALLDDTPVIPGDTRPAYADGGQARQILNDCEDDLRDWRAETELYDAPAAEVSPVKEKQPALDVEADTGVKETEMDVKAAA